MADLGTGRQKKTGKERAQGIASAIGWAWGALSILLGLITIAAGGVVMIVFGTLLLPPVVRALRKRAPFMRRFGVPTLSATILAVGLIVVLPRTEAPTTIPSRSDAASPSVRTKAAPPTAAPSRDAVSIVAAGDPLAPAQAALNRGDYVGATQLLYAREVSPARRASAEGQQLKAAIQSAMDRSNGLDSGDREARHFVSAREVLEGLTDLPSDAPVSDIWTRLGVFEEAARVLEDHPAASVSGAAATERRRLKSVLVQRQATDFPAMRRAYGEAMRRNLWEQDIEVGVSGSRATVIGYTGALFAANRNIAQVQRGASPHLQKLRFAQARYRWSANFGGWNTYDLTPLDDQEVGHFEGARFLSID